MSLGEGEVLAVIGHNGAGKSTLLKVLFHLLPLEEGTVLVSGRDVAGLTTAEMLGFGVAYVPQGNRVFADLTVRENLRLGSLSLDKAGREAAIERVLRTFPALQSVQPQLAGTLSGGQKQVVALANALIVQPELLLVDEPSLGLDPGTAKTALNLVRRVSEDSGVSVVIVEQKVREVLRIADQVVVLRNGEVSYTGAASELTDDTTIRKVYF